MSRIWLYAALLGAAAFVTTPASALGDVTGYYDGSMACDRVDAQGSSHDKSDVALSVDDDGAGNAFAYLNAGGLVFRLTVVSDPDTPQQGRVGGPECSFDAMAGGALMQAVVKARPGSDQASLKGELLSLGVGASPHVVEVCRLKLKRTSTMIPMPITDCLF